MLPGLNGYEVLPFSFRVSVARLPALMRDPAPQRPSVLTAGPLSRHQYH